MGSGLRLRKLKLKCESRVGKLVLSCEITKCGGGPARKQSTLQTGGRSIDRTHSTQRIRVARVESWMVVLQERKPGSGHRPAPKFRIDDPWVEVVSFESDMLRGRLRRFPLSLRSHVVGVESFCEQNSQMNMELRHFSWCKRNDRVWVQGHPCGFAAGARSLTKPNPALPVHSVSTRSTGSCVCQQRGLVSRGWWKFYATVWRIRLFYSIY